MKSAARKAMPAIPMFNTPTAFQPTRSIETPFGLAWINDLRQPGERTLGRIGFVKPTIDGEACGEDVHLYLESRPHGEVTRTMWFGARYSTAPSSNAWAKLHTWLYENRHHFDALRSPMTEEHAARLHKEKVEKAVREALNSVSNQGFTDAEIAEAVESRLQSYRFGMGFAL